MSVENLLKKDQVTDPISSCNTQGGGRSDPGKLTSVFDDNVNFNVVHPLQDSWQWWFDLSHTRGSSSSWNDDNLRCFATFDTAEEFWGIFNQLEKSHILDNLNLDIHVFKKGIKPIWEDPKNAHGGRFNLQIPKSRKNPSSDKLWLDTLLTLIGANTKHNDHINGCVISLRKPHDRISVWIDTTKADLKSSINERLLQVWRDEVDVSFHSTEDALKKQEKISQGGSRQKN